MSNKRYESKQGNEPRRIVRPEDEDRRTDRPASLAPLKRRPGTNRRSEDSSSADQTDDSRVEDLPSGIDARREAAKARDD